MDDHRLGRVVRALRLHRRWRQQDLAAAAEVSRATISLIETGGSSQLAGRTLRSVVDAVGGRLGWEVRWRGGELARLLDADHAALQSAVAGHLAALGWAVVAEAAPGGLAGRGRIDLLAFHPSTRVVLVVELKTSIVDLQDLLGSLQAKRRSAAAESQRLGWAAETHVASLLVAATSTNRRRIAAHAPLFAWLDKRGGAARRWLSDPRPPHPSGVLLFWKVPDAKLVGARQAGRQRVRRQRPSPRSDRCAPTLGEHRQPR